MTKKTKGISSKLLATLWGAAGAQTVAFVVNWISSGEFDRVELAQLIGVALTVGLGGLAGYLGKPDSQEVVPNGRS
jgi:hypothetical protein